MKNKLIIIMLLASGVLVAQSPKEEIIKFQIDLNKQFKTEGESPIIDNKERELFKEHSFYPINLKYRVTASFERFTHDSVFEMKTNTSRLPKYKRYGMATFIIDGKEFALTLYQSDGAIEEDGLFLAFTDATNGSETYGGGRYIDIDIPMGDKVIIDFNQSYNPFCVYDHRFSCPIPPQENDLNLMIEAGIKIDDSH